MEHLAPHINATVMFMGNHRKVAGDTRETVVANLLLGD
jgi:hypothetical protein